MRANKREDADLVGEALEGDHEAYAVIVARYQLLICSLTYSAVGCQRKSEELAHEVFVTAWRDLRKLREPGKLKSWLCGIARNHIKHFIRTETRHRNHTEPLFEEAWAKCPGPVPDEQLVRREREAMVWETLQSLPEKYRQPLILFYREENSIEKVAEALDLSDEAVRQRLSRGRRLLRKEVLAVVEETVRRTVPGAAFTATVLATVFHPEYAGAASLDSQLPKREGSGSETGSTGWFGSFSNPMLLLSGLICAAGLSLFFGSIYFRGDRTDSHLAEVADPQVATEVSPLERDSPSGSYAGENGTGLDIEALYNEGRRLERLGEYAQANGVFLAVEDLARETEQPVWRARSLWKQARHQNRQREPQLARDLYEQSYQFLEAGRGSAHRHYRWAWSLLGNRQNAYVSSGYLGKALRMHSKAEDLLVEFLSDGEPTIEERDKLLRNFYSDPAAFADRFCCIDSYLLVPLREATFLGWSGDTEAAIDLLERLIGMLEKKENLSNRMKKRRERIDFQLALRLSGTDRLDRWKVISERLMALDAEDVSYYNLYERIRNPVVRARNGEDAAALLPGAIEAHRSFEGLSVSAWHRGQVAVTGYLAELHALAGDPESGVDLLDGAIAAARRDGFDSILSELLYSRAKINLERGHLLGVDDDLLEALSIVRRLGMLRTELSISETFGRFLFQMNRFEEANRVLERSRGLAERLDDEPALKRIETELEKLKTGPDQIGESLRALSDFQPISMQTRVIEGEVARGRFLLVNPNRSPVTGHLSVFGARVDAIADRESVRYYTVAVSELEVPDSPPVEEIRLPPFSQLEVILSTSDNAPESVSGVDLLWEAEGKRQQGFWRFSRDAEVIPTAIVNASTAMDSPFYAVPLYHEIYHRSDQTVFQNIRVTTTHPSRVEIVERERGRILAVDAQGDGRFDGAGDAVFQDQSRDGFPDIVLSPDRDVASLEVFVFPHQADQIPDEVTVEIELMVEGDWKVAAVNRLLLQGLSQ